MTRESPPPRPVQDAIIRLEQSMSYDPVEQWQDAYSSVTTWIRERHKPQAWRKWMLFIVLALAVITIPIFTRMAPPWVNTIILVLWVGLILRNFLFDPKTPEPNWLQRGLFASAMKEHTAIERGLEPVCQITASGEGSKVSENLLVLRNASPTQPTEKWFDAWRHFYTYRQSSIIVARWTGFSWAALTVFGYLFVEAWYILSPPAFMRDENWADIGLFFSLTLVVILAGGVSHTIGWIVGSVSDTFAADAGFEKPNAAHLRLADVLSSALDAVGKEYAHQKGIAL